MDETPQALCASSPSRGALGIMVQSVRKGGLAKRKGGLAKLYAMLKAPLLAGAVTAGDWGVYTVSSYFRQWLCFVKILYTVQDLFVVLKKPLGYTKHNEREDDTEP